MSIYEPAEDSYLLESCIREYAIGRVLDIGTGSGIQAMMAASSPKVREVVAVDINEEAIGQLKEKNVPKIKPVISNLFENVAGKFDLIIFNPPYLPQDEGIEDQALYGGKRGWEIINRFCNEVTKYLMADGKVLLLFSTLTNKSRVEEILENNLLDWKQIASEKISFEELYVYEISKSILLRKLESQNVEDLHFFAKGKRGIIYKGMQDKNTFIKTHLPSGKKIIPVAVKVERKDSDARNRIQNEINWLKVLNAKGIGPKLLFHESNFFIYEFVDGEEIIPWIKHSNKEDIVVVLKDLIQQCYVLDELKVTKEEMHHPLKHILVRSDHKPVLIDFERCHNTDNPKNITQFLEFLARLNADLIVRGIKLDPEIIRSLASEYKDNQSNQIIEKIINQLFS
ncbi:MAG: methyltransferase [archaeon]|nr:methyltransferase [archaeon]